MLRNYLKVALRNIRKNKLYASLNILGLGIGLASFFVIYLFLQNERSYDTFHPKADRIYRVLQEQTDGVQTQVAAGLNAALAPAAAERIPEIEAFSRIETYPKQVLIPGRKDSLQVFKSLAVDKGFLDFFELSFVRGSTGSSFLRPNSVLISKSKEDTFFDGDAINKTISVNGKEYLIEGVFADIPPNSSLKADIIVPFETMHAWRLEELSWGVSYFDQTFFLFSENTDVNLIEEKINTLARENRVTTEINFKLQSIYDIHFSLGLTDSLREKTDEQYIYIFTIVAIFILACSVFNYVSLALSQSIERTKEIGVRKVVGALKGQLYRQFISESALYVLMGFVIALILVEVLVPQLEVILGRTLSTNLSNTPQLLIPGLIFSILVAGLAALYPAYIGAAQKVVSIFRGGGRFRSHRLINVISIFQIGVFMVLVSVAFTANKQMHFMQNENLGFDKENQLVIRMFSQAASGKAEVLKNALAQMPEVKSSSFSNSVPSRVMGATRFNGYDFSFVNFNVDADYLNTMGMELKEGRNFVPEDQDTANLVLINERAASLLNFGETAVGKVIDAGSIEFRVIGVVSDFHWVSKREEIGPTLFKKRTQDRGVMVVKLQTGNLVETMDQIEAKYSEITGGEVMGSFFLDDQINSQYKQEGIMIKMINTFTLVAALVAFIGLFGIAGYSARRRLKEMGIRKVLGAGFMSVQLALNKANVWKLVLAALIAVPLIVYWMEGWLDSFAYRIALPTGLIIAALIIASSVILLTAMFHSVKVYLINPVEILKDE
ncbi:MAG: FtsX-like permease family protein [Roseivirga sp.]|nr:FtsX-like permease family protein [Roseivirga sp.]